MHFSFHIHLLSFFVPLFAYVYIMYVSLVCPYDNNNNISIAFVKKVHVIMMDCYVFSHAVGDNDIMMMEVTGDNHLT